VGRPPLPEDVKLSERILIRLSKSELAAIERAAGDKPVATWAREVLVRQAKLGRRR
jgi:hypothetical protein